MVFEYKIGTAEKVNRNKTGRHVINIMKKTKETIKYNLQKIIKMTKQAICSVLLPIYMAIKIILIRQKINLAMVMNVCTKI